MPPLDKDFNGPWTSHAAFSPPKLPPPRNMSNNAVRYPYREPTPLWNTNGDVSGPSARDARYDEYGRQRSFAADADQSAAESSSRSRPQHYPDEPMSHYPPPPSVYARPTDASASRMRTDAYGREHDQVRHVDAQPRSFDPSSQRPASNNGFASSLPPYPDSRPDLYHHRQSLPRHQQELHQSRRPSAQPVAIDATDSIHYRSDTATPTWSSSRSHHPAKRPIPSDLEAETDPRSPAPLSRSYPSSAAPYSHGSPAVSKAQTPIPPPASVPASRLPDRQLQEREGSYQPTASRLHSTSDGAAPSHVHAAAAATNGLAAPPAASSGTPQHAMQPQRKRLRISRACDECRRRKTRCDIVGAFPGEPGHPLTISGAVPPLEPNMEPKGEMLILQPCMNCRRSEVTCSYSKRPLKRGPSKGYIKDLERRLNSLESQIVSGERPDGDAPELEQDGNASTAVNSDPNGTKPTKPKARTEDRISRLESVLARPSHAKSEDDKSASTDSSRRNSDMSDAHIKSEAPAKTGIASGALSMAAEPRAEHEADVDAALSTSASSATHQAASTTDSARSSVPTEVAASPASSHREPKSTVTVVRGKTKGKGKAVRRSADSSPSRAPDSDVAEVKAKVITSFLHPTFPIVPTRSEGEGSSSNNIARLEDRVLARGLRLLTEPVEMVTAAQESSQDAAGASRSKAQAHAARVANLIGQASAGLGGPRDELALHARSGADGLRALRKVAHRLSGQEADLLMLCHLDHLRNGRNNNSALAAAVAKLGSGSHVQNDRETYRRRTLLFMLDRWHAIAFGTPHLLMGRFGMERHSFRSMKEALGDVTQSPLEDAVYEVLRCAIMLGQLNDLVQNNGGWKGISKSDVDAVIHSATDENERTSAAEPTHPDSGAAAASLSGGSDGDATPGLLSTAALRYSLESLVRCYYALHTLPNARDARVEDLHRIFTLAESILVLGTAKTPISLQGKLVQSAIGPHVLAVAGVAFSWCLRIICMMVSSSLSAGATTAAASSSHAAKDDSTSVAVSPASLPLEFYRRKILDYVRMCGPFCLFSGGPPTSTGSFAPVYLRLALYFNSTVSFASQLGSLVSPQSQKASPVHQDTIALANEADNVLDMANEMGFLGYVLAGTTQGDAWRLLTGGAPATAAAEAA